jgi:hypothetical protein
MQVRVSVRKLASEAYALSEGSDFFMESGYLTFSTVWAHPTSCRMRFLCRYVMPHG